MGEREVLSSGTQAQAGLKFRRLFTREGVSPYDEVQWEQRTASIANSTRTLPSASVAISTACFMLSDSVCAARGMQSAPKRSPAPALLVIFILNLQPTPPATRRSETY